MAWQMRRDTAANWTAENPTLAEGEWALETDTGKLKVGDGTTAWTSLDYLDTGEGAPSPHDLGGEHHGADTLANLNAKVSDATLDDAGDPRDPNVHALGGAAHSSDTVANLESKLTGADLTAVVTHAADSTVARPSAAKVFWFGTVNPDNGATDDLLYRTDEDLWYRWDGTGWQSAASASVFTGLTDTPGSYTGEGGQHVAVNSAEDALEFVAPGDSGASPFLTADDATGLTWHEGTVVDIASSSYHTIFDIAAATELLGGVIFSVAVGARLTIDGTVVFDFTTSASARDQADDFYSVFLVPPAKADTSMKLELYNASGVQRTHGWRVTTR